MPEPMPTDGARVAVVTGGAGAIGGTIVRALQASGHRTAVIDRDSAISADLGSEASTRQAAATVLEQYGTRRHRREADWGSGRETRDFTARREPSVAD